MIVVYPSILYFFCKASFAFFCSALNFFLRGKSTSTSTRFFFAYSANSALEKTSLWSLMHQPHQSEPVKSRSTIFFSSLALACALGRSVNHSAAVALTPRRATTASKPIANFFIVVNFLFCCFGAVEILDGCQLALFNPTLQPYPRSSRVH